MKAAQEILIFPFPDLFTFFIMWYLKEKKNPSPTVTQSQIQTTGKKKEKKKSII